MTWLTAVPPRTDWWKLIAQGEAVGQLFEDRRLLLLGVVEAHLVAFAEVALRRGIGAGVGVHDEGNRSLRQPVGLSFVALAMLQSCCCAA